MDFLILKVNGVDVSDSQDKAFSQLMSATEPILVELRRKEAESATTTARETVTPTTSGSRDSIIFPDLEYEEVVLSRTAASQRLGLTLCYEGEDDLGNTQIYIDEIHHGGLAEQDGRLRLGDQIIQIDGKGVGTKPEAQLRFERSQGDISLLVVRPPTSADLIAGSSNSSPLYNNLEPADTKLCQLQDSGNSSLESADRSFDSCCDHQAVQPPPAPTPRSFFDEEKRSKQLQHRLSTASSKDSGHRSDSIDRSTTDSSRSESSSHSGGQLDSSAPQLPKVKHSQSLYSIDDEFVFINPKTAGVDRQPLPATEAGLLLQQPVKRADPIYEIIPEQSESDDMYCLPMDSVNSVYGGDQGPLKVSSPKYKERRIRSKSNDKIKDILRAKPGPQDGSNRLPRSVSLHQYQTKPDPPQRRSTLTDQRNNRTNGSGHPRSQQLGQVRSPVKLEVRENMRNNASLDQLRRQQLQQQQQQQLQQQSVSLHQPEENLTASYLSLNLCQGYTDLPGQLYRQPDLGDIVYTDLNNLQYIIAEQQKQLLNKLNTKAAAANGCQEHLLNQLNAKAAGAVPSCQEQLSGDRSPVNGHGSLYKSDPNWEWKVKLRPDGSRYITRRPVRTRFLEERARQLMAERASATSDDDAASELKFGKFWTKSERRVHAEAAKERRHRREELIRKKNNSSATEDQIIIGAGPADPPAPATTEKVKRREKSLTADNCDKNRFSLQEDKLTRSEPQSNEILVTVMTV